MPLKKPAARLKGSSREVGKRNPRTRARVTPTTMEPTMILIAAGFIPTRIAVPMGIPKRAAANICKVIFIAIVFRSRRATIPARMIPSTRAELPLGDKN